MKKSLKQKAIDAIQERGALLVFPMDNKPNPPALWHALHPRTKMRWEWNENGDTKVSDLWFLREQLSTSNKVVYSKWYRGRATFFSLESFVDLLRVMQAAEAEESLVGEARQLYEIMCESSPRSTKELKRESELTGKLLEPIFQKAMKRLFESGLIVAYGEVDEGAFPSLATGATKSIFEDLWIQGQENEKAAASMKRLRETWAPEFIKFLDQILSKKNGSNRT